MMDPPDSAIVKHPRSFTEISDNCATYSAKSVANSSENSKILSSVFFFASNGLVVISLFSNRKTNTYLMFDKIAPASKENFIRNWTLRTSINNINS
jgi:hypothetical protein